MQWNKARVQIENAAQFASAMLQYRGYTRAMPRPLDPAVSRELLSLGVLGAYSSVRRISLHEAGRRLLLKRLFPTDSPDDDGEPDPTADTLDNVLLFFCRPGLMDHPFKPGVHELKAYAAIAEAQGFKRMILVTSEGLTPPAKKEQSLLTYPVELFLYSEFESCPVEHELVPVHRLLTVDEAAVHLYTLQEEFDLVHPRYKVGRQERAYAAFERDPDLKRKLLEEKSLELKRIEDTERIARYYGLKEGDIIQIHETRYAGEILPTLYRVWPAVRLSKTGKTE